MVVELQAAGLPLKADLDQAWRDFAGWRVNYDTVLIAAGRPRVRAAGTLGLGPCRSDPEAEDLQAFGAGA